METEDLLSPHSFGYAADISNQWISSGTKYGGKRPMLTGKPTDRVNIADQLRQVAHPRLSEFCGEGIQGISDDRKNFGSLYECTEGMLLGLLDKIHELETQVFNLEHEATEDTYGE